jgi:uncharacterized alkaline shock family protein YloU
MAFDCKMNGAYTMASTQAVEATRQDLQALPNSSTTANRKDGTTTISDQVVAKIAGIAAREVEGVHELTGTGFTGAVSGLANKVSGSDAHDYGVKVQVGHQETIVNLAMVVDYGASIPNVAKAIRKSISEQLQVMTGLVAREINISVTDIAFPEEAAAVATTHELQ